MVIWPRMPRQPSAEPNDYAVANSMGLGNVDLEKFYQYLKDNDAVGDPVLWNTQW